MEKMYPKAVQSTTKCFHHPTPPPPPPSQIKNIHISPAVIKLSRRDLTLSTKSSLLLLLTSQFHLPIARAASPQEEEEDQRNLSSTKPPEETLDENPIDTNTITTEDNPVATNTTAIEDNPVKIDATTTEEDTPAENVAPATTTEETPVENVPPTTEENPTENGTNAAATTTNDCTDKVLTKRAFLDISVDGKPIGRIVIGLYGNNVPAGATRFADFVGGAAGISYRRKEFVKITPSYVQHGGVRSYGVDAELAAKTGRKLGADNLIDELERENGRCPGIKNVAGSVGIVVRDPFKPPPKQKLVARQGKLVIDEEEVGKDPNGTEFVITTKDSPELDASTLVIGKVLEGTEVVEKMGQVKTVQENTSSPYFRVAKLIGDKRAVVAERGFNRPYSKVVVTNCGLMA